MRWTNTNRCGFSTRYSTRPCRDWVPGGDASTRKALDTVLSAAFEGGSPAGPTGLAILDLGCGNGAQTIQLAKHTDGEILAVDNDQPFLDELRRKQAFQEKRFLEDWNDCKPDEDRCLLKMGCKGPSTHADCPTREWNSATNWCVGVNDPCHGCTEPDFHYKLPHPK